MRQRRDLSNKSKALLAGALAATTAVVVGAGLVYDDARTKVDIAPPQYDPAAAQQLTPASIVTFLGDSYTRGIGAPAEGSYAHVLSAAFCWQANYMGQGGTGYVNPGQPEEGEAAYGARVGDVIASRPNAVVVQGSTNDPGGPTNVAAAADVFGQLRAGLPDAQIIAVGPTAPPAEDAERVSASREAVREAAQAAGVTFIDPSELLRSDTDYAPDGVHPNESGHRKLGQGLYRQLRDLNLNVTNCATAAPPVAAG